MSCPWVGSSAPISQRVSQLLAKMTVAQKVTVLTGARAQGAGQLATERAGEQLFTVLNRTMEPASVTESLL